MTIHPDRRKPHGRTDLGGVLTTLAERRSFAGRLVNRIEDTTMKSSGPAAAVQGDREGTRTCPHTSRPRRSSLAAQVPSGGDRPWSTSLARGRSAVIAGCSTAQAGDIAANPTGPARARRSGTVDHCFGDHNTRCGRVLGTGSISNRDPLMSSPVADLAQIGHLDFAPQCQLGFLDNGFRCALPAVAYVQFHMVGHCKRFDCDADGNACGYVCADHLDALEYTAECAAAEMQPTALSRWLINRVARCPTCDRPILNASDILQAVVML